MEPHDDLQRETTKRGLGGVDVRRGVHMTSRASALLAVKLAHTVVWAFFAACIFAIPVFTWLGKLDLACAMIAIVAVEVAVLALNRWSCPLTAVAARYTADRRDNFDIYLPEWLARRNKEIFGTLYVAGLLYTLVSWWAD